MKIALSFVLLVIVSVSAFGGFWDKCGEFYEDLHSPGARRHRELEQGDARSVDRRARNEEDQYENQVDRGGSQYVDERMEERIKERKRREGKK